MTATAPRHPPKPAGSGKPLLSLVTPAFQEMKNLPEMYREIERAMNAAGIAWEWIVVDDHSPDQTWTTIRQLSLDDPRIRGLRLARNAGSHSAVRCGMALARGGAVAILASDLQDPPAVLPQLVSRWQAGFRIVWAVRRSRQGESRGTLAFSRIYYWIMRNLAGMRQMPPNGADFVLLDRSVVNALGAFRESNTNLYALIAWMGFDQTSVEYDKQARLYGGSGWTLAKKITLLVDSLTSFTFAPIRWISLAGFLSTALAFGWAALILRNAIDGHPVEGWTSVMLAILLLGGLQMIMLGVLGEYLWRALDEIRQRPRVLVEDQTFEAGTEGA